MLQCKSIVVAGTLSAAAVAAMSCASGSESPAGDAGSDGISVINRAGAIERMLERTAPHIADTAVAPSFVVDPGWPKPLPHNWRLGQIGGLFVDRHDTIWVYHRPRSLSSTEAGALDVAGKDAKGNPVSALGHPRAFGQHSGCCVPAPSVLRFDKAGNLLQAWGGTIRSRLSREEVPARGRVRLAGPRARHLCRPQ